MNPSIGSLPGSRPEGPIEVLYESPTTRVFRQGSAAASVICKEFLRADANQRRHLEGSILERLSGVAGVVRAAEGLHPGPVLVLQDTGGVTLAQALRTRRCDIATALALGAKLARILAEVHRAGVIHRDLNPANILMSAGGEPLLIDFDLAVLADQHFAVAQDGQIVGTLDYLAPEQTGRTGRAVDQRADLYALGATLYEVVTNQKPFDAQDTLQLIHDHLVREPVAPAEVDSSVPRTLSDIIMRLLAKAPEQRYQSAEGLLHDLQRLRDEIAHGQDALVELGERDFAARLTAPARLVGRDAESAVLRRALADTQHALCRTVLIEGSAGVGKSALINDLRPAVAAAGGWFVQGKYDQYQKDASTEGALTQALQALGRLLLTRSASELAEQRRRMLDALGRNAGVITGMWPEFALLLGAHPEPLDVDPRQAERRLQQAIVDLLGAIASPQQPLVVLLDDLHWAAGMSLRAFGRLMGEPGLGGLLLVGTYRSEEADTQHGLTPMLALWRQLPYSPIQIKLANLPLERMSEMVGQMLRLPPARAAELARAVGALAGGNPFDTVEMINALRGEGVLRLGEQGWEWREADIRRFVGRGNVVDLLAIRVARLPPSSRDLLEFMGCLGNSLECQLLGVAAGLGLVALRTRLRAALDDGLVLAHPGGGEGSVQFRHDRVQQAVLDAMDPAQRSRRHLEMARRLALEPDLEDQAAQQYLACVARLSEPHEQRRAARMFHRLAQKLARTATYSLAERYLAAAAALLAEVNDPADTELRSAIHVGHHAALYSLGRLEAADSCYVALQACTADPLALVESACLQMRSLDMRARMNDTMQLGRRLLAQLGLDIPEDYRAGDTEERLDALTEWVRLDSEVDHPRRVQVHDRRLRYVARLLDRMVRSAYYLLDLEAFAWLLLESQRLWAEHGPCPEMVATLGRMNGLLISRRQDYRNGFDVARHVLAVADALGYEPQASEARMMFSAYACHWFEPLEKAAVLARSAHDGVRAGGDASFACYTHRAVLMPLIDTAPTVDVCANEVESALALCHSTGNSHAAALATCERQLMRALSGQTLAPGSFDDAEFSQQAFMEQVGSLPYVSHTLHTHQALNALLLGDLEGLGLHGPRAMALLGNLPGYYMSVHSYLFVAMARAWQLQAGPPADPTPLWAELDACRNWLAARAADQPHNFLHLLRLVEAEQAWARGDWWAAATTFDAAVAEAGTRQRPWHRALITERAGLFQLTHGLAQSARHLLASARDHYSAWGAQAKVAQMQREHAFLQIRPLMPGQIASAQTPFATGHSMAGSGTFSSDAIDLVGVLRASQALSSETSMERLTARISEVLAALSGATDVRVLSSDNDQWWLLAPAPNESSISVAQAGERGLLPLSAFSYAERTQEPLLVDDAVSDDRFARDPYFAEHAQCSLLLVPIGQGATRAMLYLENSQGRAAFSAQRLDTVMLIAGQLAVSLANVQLYESLEQRVQARTRELRDTQAQLVATARRTGRAEIANNVLHNVGNVLNSVNTSARVVGRKMHESRTQGLAKAVALMNEHEGDLGEFMSRDTRGRNLPVYLNKLVDALAQEREEIIAEVDALIRSVDHINDIVTTQQSHSGAFSAVEMANIDEVLEEAVHMNAASIARHDVTVVRQFDEVPAMLLDRSRLLQILVNLISNATQAMDNTPVESRKLTLGAGLKRNAGGDDLRITVRDEGEGIAPENLTRIFSHGFTTRRNGHGFGLHSSAMAAAEFGGALTAVSEGRGRGAMFVLELPVKLQDDAGRPSAG